jgi:succinate dehydrogenase/fumarate reductase flavoprotein subunit
MGCMLHESVGTACSVQHRLAVVAGGGAAGVAAVVVKEQWRHVVCLQWW